MDTCTYSCDPGYSVDGIHTCGANGTFSGGQCQANPCLVGRHIQHSATLCNGTTGDSCPVVCDPGYHRVGNHTCGIDGVWGGATCVPNVCAPDRLVQSSTNCTG